MEEELTYQEFSELARSGRILVGIDPAVARKFYTNSDPRWLEEQLGESMWLERLTVKSFWLLDFGTLIAGIVITVLVLKWFSVIAVPLMVVAWFFLGGLASVGRQRLTGAFAAVAVCLLLGYLQRQSAVGIWFSVLPWPYFFARLTYWTETRYLRALVVRNERAFRLLREKDLLFVKWAEDYHPTMETRGD